MEGRRQRREEVGAVFSTVAVAVDGDGEGREGERRRGLGRCSARSVAAVGKERKPWNSMVAVTMDDDGGEGGGSGGGGGRWLRAEHRRWRKEGREVAPVIDKGGDEEITAAAAWTTRVKEERERDVESLGDARRGRGSRRQGKEAVELYGSGNYG